MDKRRDYALAASVARGLALDCEFGSVIAWAYLVRFNVPIPVILRVLADTSCRRFNDPASRYLIKEAPLPEVS